MRRFLLCLALLATGIIPAADIRAPFLVNYADEVDGAELALYKTVILSQDTRIANLRELRQSQTRVLGHISLGEITRENITNPDLAKIPVLGENRQRGGLIPDVTLPIWSDWVVNQCAAKIAARGWDGVFLDRLDGAHLPAGLDEETYAKRTRALADIIRRLKRAHPGMSVVVNRGFPVVELAHENIDGILADGVLTLVDPNGEAKTANPGETSALRKKLDTWKTKGKTIYALDYAKSGEFATAEHLYNELSRFGYEALITNGKLKRDAALAPLKRLGRNALVLFDSEKGAVEGAAKCLTRTTLLHPLTRHGYNLEYANLHDAAFPSGLSSYDLVVVEPFEPSRKTDMQRAVLEMAKRLRSGKKTIFLGSLKAWTESPERWRTLSSSAGWTGSGRAMAQRTVPAVDIADPELLMPEGRAAPRAGETYPDLQAPKSALPLIRQTLPGKTNTTTIDPVFVADFGGVILHPWLSETDAIGRTKARVDFHAFVDRLLGTPAPAFDTTTRTGRRIVFTHINGEGLFDQSKVAPGKFAGEVMRREIITKYPVPFTVAAIPDEIRAGTEKSQSTKESERRAALVRDLFTISNVEPAAQIRTRSANASKNPAEETTNTFAYLNKTICPSGKSCKIMVCSGDVPPSPASLMPTDAAGIPTLHGAATDASRENPFIARIQGGTITAAGVTLVASPFENDASFRGMDKDGLEGGFARVIESFEITGSPRRLQPVAIGFEFACADTDERLNSLRKVLNWAADRPLHPVFASEYAGMMRELPKGIRYTDTRGGHLFAMPAGCLTIRYPAPVHVDMRRSSGVLGYTREADVTYVHTDGAPAVRIVLRENDDGAPKLVFSTRPATIVKGEKSWAVTFDGFCAGKARFTGFAPGGSVTSPGGSAKIGPDGSVEVDARPGERMEIPLP